MAVITNSSIRLQKMIQDAARRADLAPALSAAGSTTQPGMTIGSEVMNALCRGGPDGERNNWKWNRLNVIPSPIVGTLMAAIGGFGTFLTNSWQQDYAVPGVINVDWIEEAPAVNINQITTGSPKQILWPQPVRNLSKESIATGFGRKICFLPNNLLEYGIWGQTSQNQVSGLNNPGPGVVYTNPLGPGLSPANPINQVIDPNGNLWVLTTYGTCGSTQPSWPTNPTYPRTSDQSPVTATTVTDGTCVWTALNPYGQGFRLDAPAPQNGIVWLFRVVAQMMPIIFYNSEQTLGPLPDDMAVFFRTGFEALCQLKSNDPKVRASGMNAYAMWQKALKNSVQASNREQEDMQFVPGTGLMSGPNCGQATPLYPFLGWGFGGN